VPIKLQGSVAVVTGASSGIGEATARAFARRGSHVLLVARNQHRLSMVVDQIRGQGHKADAYPVDLSDPKAISRVVAQLTQTHGSPHIVVNNAGAGRWLPMSATSAEEAAQMMAVPYLAAFNVTRDLLPGMVARRCGHIVNVTSVAARLAWPGAVAYTAARAAMEGFTNALRAELHGSGVGVTLATFGAVDTPYWEHNPGSRERLPRLAALIPVLPADKVAGLIVAAVAKGSRTVVAPALFRLLFFLNALSPAPVEVSLRS